MTGAQRIDEIRDRVPEFLLLAFVLAAGALAGTIAVHDARLGAVVVAGLVVLLLVSRRPVALAIVATAAVYAVQRLGSTSTAPGSAGGLSYSDALVATAAIMALPGLSGTAELRRLRPAAMGIAVYLALLLPGVIASPSTHVYLEWIHRLVMVGGGLLVGAWLTREKAHQAALRLLVVISVLVALAAMQYSVSHNFAPAFPLGLHKNFVGSLFAGVLIVLFMAAPTLHIAPALRFSAVVIVGLGLLASVSRGGELGAVLGLLVASVLDPRAHSLRVKIFGGLVAAGLAVVAFISVHHQLTQDKTDLNNSSAGVRVNVEHITQATWRTSPYVGVGLKYYNTGKYGGYASNNVVDNELAESGVIGLAGFVVFQVAALNAGVRRRRSPLAAAAVGVIAGQLLHGMVDIYWSAGVVTLPFLLLGIALAGPGAPSGPRTVGRRVRIGIHRAT